MTQKKKLGIIGGMGARAGSLFLQKIIDYSPAESDQEFPEIIYHNNSLIPDRTKAILSHEASPVPTLLRSIELFNENNVQAIALGCITAYYYYDQISPHTVARIIHPIRLVAEQVRKDYNDVSRIGLLAASGTIRSGLFHRELQACSVEIVTLSDADQEDIFMRSIYMKNGLKSAVTSIEAKELICRAAKKLEALGIDLLIGGCTEVSVGLNLTRVKVPYIDALDLLARKTVEYCYRKTL